MKTLFRTNKLVVLLVGIVCSVLIYACTQPRTGGSKTSKVEISEHMIVVHPTAQISPGDEQAMNAVLGRHTKSLYKVEKLEKGRVKKTQGRLADVHISAQLKSEVAKAKTAGAFGDDLVILCNICDPQHIVSPDEPKKLIQELKPILEKY